MMLSKRAILSLLCTLSLLAQCSGFRVCGMSSMFCHLVFSFVFLVGLILTDTLSTPWYVSMTGNYCGPNWCSGEVVDEKYCPFQTPSVEGSCADSCCKAHDHCCGTGDRSSCNRAIVRCLDSCGSDGKCKRDGISVSPSLIADAMNLVSSWCCGSECPTVDGSSDDDQASGWRK